MTSQRYISCPRPPCAGGCPPEAARFVTDYETALDDDRTSLDQRGVLDVVARWRRIAILQTDRNA